MKMKFIIYVTVSLVFTYIKSYSQEKIFPDGIYLNAAQLKNRTPAFNAPLTVTIREKSERVWAGGSEYRLESNIDSLNKKYLKKKVFAYVKGDSLFINDLNAWFSLALTKGNFVVFRTSDDPKAQSMGMMFGMVGALAYASSSADKTNLAVISLRTGNIRMFNKNYVAERLKDYPDLYEQFGKEGYRQYGTQTLLNYVEKLNKRVSLDK